MFGNRAVHSPRYLDTGRYKYRTNTPPTPALPRSPLLVQLSVGLGLPWVRTHSRGCHARTHARTRSRGKTHLGLDRVVLDLRGVLESIQQSVADLKAGQQTIQKSVDGVHAGQEKLREGQKTILADIQQAATAMQLLPRGQ